MAKVALFNAFPGKRLFLPSLLALFSVSCGDAVSVDENANVELDETEPQITQARSTPVVFIDEDRIETIRDRIRRGEAPWTAAYQRVVDEGNRALDAGPWSVTANGGPAGGHDFFTEPPYCGWTRVDGNPPDCRDSQFNPEANRVDYTAALRVAEAARSRTEQRIALLDLLLHANTQSSGWSDFAFDVVEPESVWTTNVPCDCSDLASVFDALARIDHE